MIDSIIYWTGAMVWIFISAILLALFVLAMEQFWNRTLSVSLENIRFGLFGSSKKGFHYYERWDMIYHRPGLHRHWTKKHHNYSRFAYKRLVREARKESLLHQKVTTNQ